MSRPKKNFPPPPSKKELEDKAKTEEFWSDPCWTEPLDKEVPSRKVGQAPPDWSFGADDSWA
jgi:hypothetical protein